MFGPYIYISMEVGGDGGVFFELFVIVKLIRNVKNREFLAPSLVRCVIKLCIYTANTLCRKFETNIPRNETAQPRS